MNMNKTNRLKTIRNWKYCRKHSQEDCERANCPYRSEVSCEWLLSKDIVSILDADTRELNALRNFKQYFDSLYGQGLEVANWHMNGNFESFDNFYDSAMAEYDAILNNNIKE